MATPHEELATLEEDSVLLLEARETVRLVSEDSRKKIRKLEGQTVTRVDEVAFAFAGLYLNSLEPDPELSRGLEAATACLEYTNYIYYFNKFKAKHWVEFDRLRGDALQRNVPKKYTYTSRSQYKHFTNEFGTYYRVEDLRDAILQWCDLMILSDSFRWAVDYTTAWTFET